MRQKKKFEVLEHETIADCLERMKKAGYRPVERIERPMFKETRSEKGQPEHYRQKIIFTGVKI